MQRQTNSDNQPPSDALDAELRELEDIPEPWLAVGEGRLRPEEAFPDRRELQEELAPLDPDARARMVAHAIGGLSSPAPAAAPAPANGVPLAPRNRRWLLWTAPLAAAAVVLLALLPDGEDEGAARSDEVRVFSALRGDDPGGQELRVAGGEHFYLQCRDPDGEALEIVAARATKVGEPSEQRMLGGKPAPQGRSGEALHVLADLGSGAWDVTCGARRRVSGQFVWLDPPARVIVE